MTTNILKLKLFTENNISKEKIEYICIPVISVNSD